MNLSFKNKNNNIKAIEDFLEEAGDLFLESKDFIVSKTTEKGVSIVTEEANGEWNILIVEKGDYILFGSDGTLSALSTRTT